MKKMVVLSFVLTFVIVLVLSGCGKANQNAASPSATGQTAKGSEQSQSSNTDQSDKSQTPAKSSDNTKPAAAKPITLQFYYPVDVGGAISKTIQGYVDQFNKENQGKIKVNPVFSGNYTDSLTKIKTAIGAGKSPDVAIMLQSSIYDLTDLGYAAPLDDYIKQAGGDKYLSDFFPALLDGSTIKDKRYSLPFQRSTQVLFYNKKLFETAGIKSTPKNWNELVADAQKLTKTEGGKTTRWGLQLSVGGYYNYWDLQPFSLENGVQLANPEGTKTDLDNPKNVEAIQFVYDLAHKYKVMPAGPQKWSDVPTNFLSGKAAMMINTTGQLGNILKKAEFSVGVAQLPTQGGKKTNLGGGNIYIMQKINQAHKDAAWKFVQFMTSPKIVADWSKVSGYIASRKSAYDLPAMKDYTSKYPQALVARDELQYAGAEMATHNNGKVINDYSHEIDEVINGKKKAADAMKAAQQAAVRELRGF